MNTEPDEKALDETREYLGKISQDYKGYMEGTYHPGDIEDIEGEPEPLPPAPRPKYHNLKQYGIT